MITNAVEEFIYQNHYVMDVVEEDREKTAFATPDGLYQFRKFWPY